MPNNKNRFVAGFIFLAFSLLAACSAGSPSLPPTTITVTPANPFLPLNRVLQLTATTNTGRDVTAASTWTSDVPLVADVNASGLVTVVGPSGSATITATYNSTITASTVVTLSSAVAAFTVGSVADPLATQQWHLKNTGQNAYADAGGTIGQDINVDPAYSAYGIDGTGVTVAVVDSGLEILHEDLSANVVAGGSWNFLTGTTDPTYTGSDGDHGTSVSGLIAATRNTAGGIGVASGASLKGFNVLNPDPGYTYTNADFAAALGGSASNPNSRDVYVFNQSYGMSYIMPIAPITSIENTLAYGVANLRGKKGALYVKAAGNGFEDFGYPTCGDAIANGISCENVNVDPENSLPYNIVVSALNADGVKSSYSTTGSAVWVSAPGGEYGWNSSIMSSTYPPATYPEVYKPAMISTDQSGCSSGYATTAGGRSVFNQGGADNASCNYTNGMNGTSSATPVTAGVVALILEANPALSWRDVKHILATTSTQVDAAKAPISITLGTGGPYEIEPGWTTKVTGPQFHNWYGFGRVNAAAAVAAAQSYVYGSLGTFQSTGFRSSGTVNKTIPDDSTAGASSTITVTKALTIEAVQIKVNIDHWYVGDLTIELTSPAGTRSVLKTTYDGMANTVDATGFKGFRLASNAFYGEASAGAWTLKVVDGWIDTPPANPGKLNSWSLNIYGH